MHPSSSLVIVVAISAALVGAQTTAAGQGSDFVGYISQSQRFVNSRTCDFPATLSTSGSFVQCCEAGKACPFFTACSSNTLLAASGSPVACDTQPSLTCNTAIVVPTASATNSASYLACWQTSLGSQPFTFVQDIGSAMPATMSQRTGTRSSSSANMANTAMTEAPAGTNGGSQTTTSVMSSSSNAAAIIGSGVMGCFAFLAQALL